jgi:hypothetical protein
MNKEQVEAEIELIKQRMPETYQAIQSRAQSHGRSVYAQVRQGIAGQPNTFYAIEAGHVVGTPFDKPEVTDPIAAAMVKFGCKFLVMWGMPTADHPPPV